MNSGELTRIQLANRLVCASQQISIGPTGPTGSAGPAFPITGLTKSFTIFVDFSSGVGISKVYIPPGLFSASAAGNLALGGAFTTDVAPDLVFTTGNRDQIALSKTEYAFITGIAASGYYSTGQWNPVSGGNIGNTKLHYQINSDYSTTITNINTTILTGGNTAIRPSGTSADGYLGTVTLFYL
jgi:hypothetical protein